MAEELTNTSIGLHLSLGRSVAFTSLAWEYLSSLKSSVLSASQPLTPDLIKVGCFVDCPSHSTADREQDPLKVYFLEFLRARGLIGLHEFMYTFISTLASRTPPTIAQ